MGIPITSSSTSPRTTQLRLDAMDQSLSYHRHDHVASTSHGEELGVGLTIIRTTRGALAATFTADLVSQPLASPPITPSEEPEPKPPQLAPPAVEVLQLGLCATTMSPSGSTGRSSRIMQVHESSEAGQAVVRTPNSSEAGRQSSLYGPQRMPPPPLPGQKRIREGWPKRRGATAGLAPR